jgi:hypothetical protein
MSLGTPQSHASWNRSDILNAARTYTPLTDTYVVAAGSTESAARLGTAAVDPAPGDFAYRVPADTATTPVLSQRWAPTANDVPPVLCSVQATLPIQMVQ